MLYAEIYFLRKEVGNFREADSRFAETTQAQMQALADARQQIAEEIGKVHEEQNNAVRVSEERNAALERDVGHLRKEPRDFLTVSARLAEENGALREELARVRLAHGPQPDDARQ
jgi:hypothetical protein